jgi:hypothetical protein
MRPTSANAAVVLDPEHVAVGFVLEDGTPITRRDLARWREPVDDVFRTSLANLLARSPTDAWLEASTVDGLYQYDVRDGLAASRMLLLPQLLEPWPLEGVVIAAPSPSRLLVAPLEEAEDLKALPSLLKVASLHAGVDPDPLVSHAYWFDGAAYRPLAMNGGELVLPAAFIAAINRLTSVRAVALQGVA